MGDLPFERHFFVYLQRKRVELDLKRSFVLMFGGFALSSVVHQQPIILNK